MKTIKNGTFTAKYLREILRYDSQSGHFFWRSNGARAGGLYSQRRYWAVKIGRRQYMAHRLAWFYVHGCWPREELDHIDGNGHNNRIENLRLATRVQNMGNSRRADTNTSGFKGVTYRGHEHPFNPWRARLRIGYVKGKRIRLHLGDFRTPKEAHAAYVKAAKKYFGDFAREQ